MLTKKSASMKKLSILLVLAMVFTVLMPVIPSGAATSKAYLKSVSVDVDTDSMIATAVPEFKSDSYDESDATYKFYVKYGAKYVLRGKYTDEYELDLSEIFDEWGEGTYKVKAYAKAKNTKSSPWEEVEYAGPSEEISLTANDVTVEAGKSVAADVNCDVDDADLTYASSDEDVATVDEDGVITGVKVGTADITVTATADGYADAEETFKVTVTEVAPPDTEKPVITLNGSATMNLTQGDTFTDPGATVTDNVDKTLTATVTGTVDTATVGTYTLTYNATDAAGNAADPVTRTVVVAARGLAVQSVEAVGLQQIKVVFNSEVEATATTMTNYKLSGVVPGGNSLAKLMSDNKTLIITLNAAYTQNTTKGFALVENNTVQSKETGKFASAYTKDITFSDLTAPVVEQVKASGNKKITVTFSEPVGAANAANAANYKLDSASLSAFGGTPTAVTGYITGNALTNSVDINFDTALSAGTHTLTIGASTTNLITDTASFTLAQVDNTFEIANVTTEPQVVSVTGSVSGEVKVVFSEKLNAATVTAGTPFTVNSAAAVNGAIDAKDTTGKTVVVTVASTVVKEGANLLVIGKNLVADVYGNKVAPTTDLRLSFTASKDSTAPTITSAYPLNETQIRVIFSEVIDIVYLANSNFILKDSTGKEVVGGTSGNNWNSFTLGSDNSIVNLNLTAAQAAALGKAQYTLVVKNVADPAANIMAETTKTITTLDTTAPTLATGSNLLVNSAKRTAQILYSEPMDATSIATLSNYMYNPDGNGFVALPSAATIVAATDAKSATITFPLTENVAGWVATAKVRAIGVKDAAGNVISGGTQDTANQAAASTANNPLVVAASLKVYADTAKVWATFDTDQVLDAIDKTDFNAIKIDASGVITIKDAAAGFGETCYTPDSATRTNKTVTLTWTNTNAMKDLKAAGRSISMPATSTYSATTNSDGAPLKVGASAVNVSDNIAPELDATTPVTLKTASSVEIKFNEVLMDAAALYANDFVVMVNGELVPDNKITATLDGTKKIITLTLSGYSTTDPSKLLVKAKTVLDVKDSAGNLYVPTADQVAGNITKTDAVGPVLASWTMNMNSNGAAKNIVLTFSEPVLVANLDVAKLAIDNASDTFGNGAALSAAGVTKTQTSSNVITLTTLGATNVATAQGQDALNDAASTFFLALDTAAVTDGTNNSVAANGIACGTFVADTTKVSITGVTADQAAAVATITVTFDDYVVAGAATAANWTYTQATPNTFTLANGALAADALSATVKSTGGDDALANGDTLAAGAGVTDIATNAVLAAADTAAAGADVTTAWTIN